MGGGDLNFKKSWHPAVRGNIEKVWKAEQQALTEKRKTEQLMKELHEERAREEIARVAEDTGHRQKSDKVEWMYTGALGAENRDDFLLGKPVDKTVLLKGTKQDDAATDLLLDDSAFASSEEPAAALSNIRDMSAKVREDPMFAIKKRQQEQLRLMMVKSKLGVALDKKKKSKKAKKSKKKSKHRHRDDSDNEDNSDKADPDQPRAEAPRHVASQHRSRSPSPDRRSRRQRSPVPRRSRSPPRRRSPVRRRSPPRRARSPRRSRSPPRRRTGRSRSPPRRDDDRRRGGSRSPVTRRARSPPRERQPRAAEAAQPPAKALDSKAEEEENKRKLEAMLSNGKWRQEDRETRVAQYNAELKQEEDALTKRRNPDFIKDMNEQSWNSDATASLEDRLRRNKHYVQRTSHSFDSGGLA